MSEKKGIKPCPFLGCESKPEISQTSKYVKCRLHTLWIPTEEWNNRPPSPHPALTEEQEKLISDVKVRNDYFRGKNIPIQNQGLLKIVDRLIEIISTLRHHPDRKQWVEKLAKAVAQKLCNTELPLSSYNRVKSIILQCADVKEGVTEFSEETKNAFENQAESVAAYVARKIADYECGKGATERHAEAYFKYKRIILGEETKP